MKVVFPRGDSWDEADDPRMAVCEKCTGGGRVSHKRLRLETGFGIRGLG